MHSQSVTHETLEDAREGFVKSTLSSTKRGLLSGKRALHSSKSSSKRALHSSKRALYTLAECESRGSRGCTVKCTSKEPYLLSKEPYILAQEPYILAKEPYMHSQSVSHEAPEDAPLSTFLKRCLFRVRIRVVRTECLCHVCVCVCVWV